MQPSEFEIQREVETLRDIRRRSTAQGGILDPDLPTVSSDSSSSNTYWDDSSNSSHGEDVDGDTLDGNDPSHLFWVPARLHPEIAPAEFRAFLKEHARGPAEGASLGRSSSVGSTGLGRKRSMLSRQYNPSDQDSIEEEKVVPTRRNRTSLYANPGPQLTISDLQKLEELAEEASQSRDPSRLRSVLRRSISMNISPSVIDQMDMPDQGDEADAPIIVPRPGQILRRAARTKIRKPGTGEGPHRFQTTRSRRGSAPRSNTGPEPLRTSSDMSSSDHGDHIDEPPRRKRADSDVPELPILTRPDSYSEESSIYDAYAREDSDESEPQGPLLVSSPENTAEFRSFSPPPILPTPTQQPPPPEHHFDSSGGPVLHHPKPQRVLSPPLTEPDLPHRSPSPEIPPVPPLPADLQSPQPSPQRPALVHQQSPYHTPPPSSPSPGLPDPRKDKDKKGLFGKWGGDKNTKKGQGSQPQQKEKDKDSGFFGSLFGKKKQDEAAPPPIGGIGNSGRETAAALLGSSKSAKNYVPPPSPQPLQGYARYPIHVERAIYRLSHIKLANPRRPLYEQVLISNLMFWYLGVINKTPTPASPASQSGAASANGDADKDHDQVEREKREKEEKERAEKERLEKEREREREKEKERERAAEQKRRGSLTKTPVPGAPGARRAEMPVRGPQYDMQHRAMEQEYGFQTGNGIPRTSSAAPPPMNPYSQPGHRGPPSGQYSSVQLVQPQPQQANNRYYNHNSNAAMMGQPHPMHQPPLQLPPGAMPPVAVEQTWLGSPTLPPGPMQPMPPMQQQMPRSSPTSPPPRVTSPPKGNATGPPHRVMSPPSGQRYSPQQEKLMMSGQGRTPTRSLSASATPAVPQHRQINGNSLSRKGGSAHAVLPYQRASEEDDLPLSALQQQRK